MNVAGKVIPRSIAFLYRVDPRYWHGQKRREDQNQSGGGNEAAGEEPPIRGL
jgi:hypothetical protein